MRLSTAYSVAYPVSTGEIPAPSKRRASGSRGRKAGNMETGHATEYFLGSNSERGFFSLYSDMADTSAGDFIWLIKGGPGCGKSSFMRKIGAAAESAGFSVEYTRCSGDPDSLDAV